MVSLPPSRLRFALAAAVASAALLPMVMVPAPARATTLEVGPGKTYATPCQAIAAAQMDDVVEVAAGTTYTDSCAIAVTGLTLRGVGGRPKIDLSGTDHPAQYKGIYVITASRVVVENLELTGAHIASTYGSNAAGLRIQANDAVVRGCYFHDNQNGILASPAAPGTGMLVVENSEFDHNGLGDGCTGSGCTHNLYIGDFEKLVFRYNWSHDMAHDLDDKGHLLKSRAYQSLILYNRITGEGGHESYDIDLPNGGLAVVIGNLIQKGPAPDNFSLLTYGLEGLARPDKRLFVVNNTFVNEAFKGTFINVASGATLTAHNNLFVGAGTVSTTGALSADNLKTDAPLFVDAAHYDYRLAAGSPAIDLGVDPGTADTIDLTPTRQYLHPANSEPRVQSGAALDLGAYEYPGASVTPDAGSSETGADATVEGLDASAAIPDASATGPGDDAGAGEPVAGVSDGDRSGCGCASSGAGVVLGGPALLIFGAGAIRARRRIRTSDLPG